MWGFLFLTVTNIGNPLRRVTETKGRFSTELGRGRQRGNTGLYTHGGIPGTGMKSLFFTRDCLPGVVTVTSLRLKNTKDTSSAPTDQYDTVASGIRLVHAAVISKTEISIGFLFH